MIHVTNDQILPLLMTVSFDERQKIWIHKSLPLCSKFFPLKLLPLYQSSTLETEFIPPIYLFVESRERDRVEKRERKRKRGREEERTDLSDRLYYLVLFCSSWTFFFYIRQVLSSSALLFHPVSRRPLSRPLSPFLRHLYQIPSDTLWYLSRDLRQSVTNTFNLDHNWLAMTFIPSVLVHLLLRFSFWLFRKCWLITC